MDYQAPWFYSVPLPTIWAGIVTILSLCMLLGYRCGARSARGVADKAQSEAPGFVASSLFGLLALILGFTFSMAIARFEGRRHLVIEEVNAIGTSYLRARLLRSPAKGELQEVLKQYVDARIAFYGSPWESGGFQAARARVTALQEKIWSGAIAATRDDRGAIESIFVASLNAVIDLENARTIALAKTLPEVIYWVILVISSAGVFALEYGRGARGEGGHGWSLLLVVVVGCVFVMIHDLERPRDGTIRITQDAMLALRDELHSR